MFFVTWMVLLLAHRGWRQCSVRVLAAAALLLGACVQMAVEICLTNVVVVFVLSLVIIGESSFQYLPAGWARWWEAFVSLCKAPARWFWLGGAVGEPPIVPSDEAKATANTVGRMFAIVAPAVGLAVLFTIVLGSGNAIFHNIITNAWSSFVAWVQSFDLSIGRICFWFLLATYALAVLRPAHAPDQPRILTRNPRVWVRGDITVARWQSYAVLGILNALFFIVNTIDALHLWHSGRIPDGVNAYDYIHGGTNSLIAATLLSAIVLAAIFQQPREVSRRPVLRSLAHLWIAQNLLLLAGVCLRWKLYLDYSHLLTAKRIHLACFLGLVAFGFFFLIMHIERGPDLRRLFWRNALTTFVLFYTLQFVNTTGLAAHRNVTQWERVPGWGLDLSYLIGQGENAWPALMRVASGDLKRERVREARDYGQGIAAREEIRLANQDWREKQFRRDAFAREVIAAAKTRFER